MISVPRVGFFTDSFHEVNGVANTSRHFARFAVRAQFPFLCVNAASRSSASKPEAWQVEVRRGPISFRLDEGLKNDLLIWRSYKEVLNRVRLFRPDLIHITGPSDIGQLGAAIAHKLGIPLVASWHTNVHEYAGTRAGKYLRIFPDSIRKRCEGFIERKSLDLTARFYGMAKLLFAPNPDFQSKLQELTGKPVHLMQRGVDTNVFSPANRFRIDFTFVFGFVGRLRPEKNVRALEALEKGLIKAGIRNYQFLIVGSGSEQEWLSRHMQKAILAGTLTGQALSKAYANMDLFVFPSTTDSFGNVALEALSSGVPAIVTSQGGPKFLIEQDRCGAVFENEKEMIDLAVSFYEKMSDPLKQEEIRASARQRASGFRWNKVFHRVYQAYDDVLFDNRFRCSLLPEPEEVLVQV